MVELDRGIIELLLERHVAEIGVLFHLGGDLLGVLPDHLQIGADDPDGDRRLRAEAHDELGHDIARLEPEGRQFRLPLCLVGDNPPARGGFPAGMTAAKNLAKPFAELLSSLNSALLARRNAHLAVVGPRMKSTMLSMPKLERPRPTKPIVISMFSGFASFSISSISFTAICGSTRRSSPAAAGTGATIARIDLRGRSSVPTAAEHQEVHRFPPGQPGTMIQRSRTNPFTSRR